MARENSRRRLVTGDLLEQAARLFAEKGFANTSLRDIADAMGVSRPALYNYVSNKEELLAALVQDVLEPVVGILERCRGRTDLAADARVALALRDIIVNNAGNTTRFRLLDRSEPDLPAEIADMHREARRRVLQLLTSMLDDAIADGQLRPLPARTVAFGMLGMANWVAWWYRAEVDGDAESMADVLVAMAMAGIRRPTERVIQPGPWAALELIDEDLAHLRGALKDLLPPPRGKPDGDTVEKDG